MLGLLPERQVSNLSFVRSETKEDFISVFGAGQEERERATAAGKMEDGYRGEIAEFSSFDSWAGINALLGCEKGAGMKMTQAGPVANENFPTEDAT